MNYYYNQTRELYSETNLYGSKSNLKDVTTIGSEKQKFQQLRFWEGNEKKINFYELFHQNL